MTSNQNSKNENVRYEFSLPETLKKDLEFLAQQEGNKLPAFLRSELTKIRDEKMKNYKKD